MQKIELLTDTKLIRDIKTLKKDFEKIINGFDNRTKFYNTEGALFWIVLGSIDYFDKLSSNFLGKSKPLTIPSVEADHFANTFYRLDNAIDYLCELWKIEKLESNEELNLLRDIRTLIVHSGQQLSNIKSLKLEGYKNMQLLSICKSEDYLALTDEKHDYCINVWVDRHDKRKNRPENEVDYDIQQENFVDISIFLDADIVRTIMLARVEKFVDKIGKLPKNPENIKRLPENIKEEVIENGEFDRLEKLIKKKLRGGYRIENNKGFWYGIGLKRLWEYTSKSEISSETRDSIRKIISDRLRIFWDKYNDGNIGDEDIPSLDIREVFKEYTPNYSYKDYLEGEKLFNNIAPNFNVRSDYMITDRDYLAKFIIATSEALGTTLNLGNDVDVNEIICDYFVKSVEVKLRSKN